MKLRPWKKLDQSRIYEGPIFSLHRRSALSPKDGQEREFQILDTPDWVNIIAVTSSDDVLLIRQYRHGTEAMTVEIPGGLVDPGETPLEAARRELAEETAYYSNDWEKIGVVEPNPAFQTNRTYTFLARNVFLGEQLPMDVDEQIETFKHPLTGVAELLTDGTIEHSLVLCAFAHLALRSDVTFDVSR